MLKYLNIKFLMQVILSILLIVYIYKYYNIDGFKNIDDNYPANTQPEVLNYIPLNIYQTWKTDNLPPKMKKNIEYLIHANPEFKHHLYSDHDCRDFIKKHFHKDVLNAYDSLQPGAYKADLWRYCILYIKGGVYLDIKYQNYPGFRLIELLDTSHYVKDIENSGRGIYNAAIISYPGDYKLLKTIREIIKNVNNKYYGKSPLSPTGPLLLRKSFTNEEFNKLDMYLGEHNAQTAIFHNKKPILVMYNGYRDEQNDIKGYKSYSNMWMDREVYKN
jgi:mannosyltransferase OCH1-like enzyme